MHRNLVSILIGCLIGVPVSIVSLEYKEPLAECETVIASQTNDDTATTLEMSAEDFYNRQLKEAVEIYKKSQKSEQQAAGITVDERHLLACLVYAEAGNQDLNGKRLVVDTVLNRVDSDTFPDTVTDVIFQKNQFTTTFDGTLERAYRNVTDECYEAVDIEISGKRLDDKVMYFTAGGYGKYGTRAYKHGDHYFCYE